MNILPELSAIAAAKYGLHLKDPIYKAFDKLIQDSRFELLRNQSQDDYTEFDEVMWEYSVNNTTCLTIRHILRLIEIINGRKGYYAKKTPLEPRDTIFYWINMLIKEYMNAGNGYSDNYTRGSGIVNGIKMRAAIYYILDILNCENALFEDNVGNSVLPSPYYLMGREITQVIIHGTESGVGYLDSGDNRYYVDVEIKNLLSSSGSSITRTVLVGEDKLYEGETVTMYVGASTHLPYSFYSVTVKDFNCDVKPLYTFTRDNEYTPGAVKEKTGTPPMTIYTVDTSLLDWVVNGAVGGVGKVGKNYLKQKTTPIPNGCIGTFTGHVHSRAAITDGYSFNTGDITTIYCTFNDGSGGVVTPSNMGNFMLVEGTTIPSAYDADANLYKDSLYQGCEYFQNYDDGKTVGTSQMFYCGTDQFGRTNAFLGSQFINVVVHTNPITLKPNTDYSVRLFNSSYPNATMYVGGLAVPGTITPQFTALSGQKSIPANGSFVTNTEQWINLADQYYDSLRARVHMPIDLRPIRYEFCESFAELKAGTYKLMIDEWGNYNMSSDWIGFSGYSGCYEDNWDGQQTGIYEWFALVKEDNTPVISKTRLFDASMDGSENRRSKTSPFPNYLHKEIEFTLTEDTKVGLMHKAYYHSTVYAYPPYFRFYIVDSDEEAEEFTTTGVSPTNMTGYSAWEKFKVTVQVRAYALDDEGQPTGLAKNTIIELDDFLYDGDSISLTSTSIDILTFEGWNTIEVLSDIQPTLYIKYQQ